MEETDTGIKNQELKEILEALDGAPQGMDVDSIVAVLTLKNCIKVNESLVELLQAGKIEARYKGDKTKDVDPDLFVYYKTKE